MSFHLFLILIHNKTIQHFLKYWIIHLLHIWFSVAFVQFSTQMVLYLFSGIFETITLRSECFSAPAEIWPFPSVICRHIFSSSAQAAVPYCEGRLPLCQQPFICQLTAATHIFPFTISFLYNDYSNLFVFILRGNFQINLMRTKNINIL